MAADFWPTVIPAFVHQKRPSKPIWRLIARKPSPRLCRETLYLEQDVVGTGACSSMLHVAAGAAALSFHVAMNGSEPLRRPLTAREDVKCETQVARAVEANGASKRAGTERRLASWGGAAR